MPDLHGKLPRAAHAGERNPPGDFIPVATRSTPRSVTCTAVWTKWMLSLPGRGLRLTCLRQPNGGS
jgi:hypothetical protein